MRSEVELRHTRLELAKLGVEVRNFLTEYNRNRRSNSVRRKNTLKMTHLDDIEAVGQGQTVALQNAMRNRSTDSNPINFQPCPATLIGLQMAKAACRNQIMRIVKEVCKACNSLSIKRVLDELYLSCANAFTDLIPIQVDNLKRNPSLALLPDSGDIIPLSIFHFLLPVCTP